MKSASGHGHDVGHDPNRRPLIGLTAIAELVVFVRAPGPKSAVGGDRETKVMASRHRFNSTHYLRWRGAISPSAIAQLTAFILPPSPQGAVTFEGKTVKIARRNSRDAV
ncbi:hypothetical protein HUU62_01650 [Rhodoferax sp. 4810]|nr:hypothetical protein [Rhodoferax jenense]